MNDFERQFGDIRTQCIEIDTKLIRITRSVTGIKTTIVIMIMVGAVFALAGMIAILSVNQG